jgi:hypothetical protein
MVRMIFQGENEIYRGGKRSGIELPLADKGARATTISALLPPYFSSHNAPPEVFTGPSSASQKLKDSV